MPPIAREDQDARKLAEAEPGTGNSVQPMVGDGGQAAPANAPLAWEVRRDEILGAKAPSDDKAGQLAALIPALSPAEQAEAARHLINLLSDEQFVLRAGEFVTNAHAPRAVQELLIADLLTGPDNVKLPMWLAVLRAPEHPRAGEAQKWLSFYFSEDFGTNWPAWEAAVEARLRNAP